MNDTEEISLGSNPLDPDTDDDGIPDTWDPLPVDADGDFDGDGILDRDEYNPNSTTGNPADSDGDGINDMRQGLASTNATSDSEEVLMNSVGGSCCYYYSFDTVTQEAI